MTRERRALMIFWTVVASLILSAFAIEATLKAETCVSAMMIDASGTTVYPEVCT